MTILTRLTKKDFEKILKNYSIGRYRSHKHLPWALMNTVYGLKTTKGKFILKIFEKANSEFIKNQIQIIDFLYKKKIPVARISKLENGKELLIYNKKKIIIQKFIKGKAKKNYNVSTLKNVAKKFGKMSKNLLKLKILDRSEWEKNHQFDLIKKFSKNKTFDLKNEAKLLLKELNKLDKKKLRKSFIHGDFHGVNLLIQNNKLKAIIDFDDAHKDYLAYEIAVFIIDPLIREKSFDKKLARIFFKEYQNQLKIKKEEKKAIYLFIKHRLLGIIINCQKQIEIHPDKKKHLLKDIIRFSLKYKIFNKISLEEFLKLT